MEDIYTLLLILTVASMLQSFTYFVTAIIIHQAMTDLVFSFTKLLYKSNQITAA